MILVMFLSLFSSTLSFVSNVVIIFFLIWVGVILFNLLNSFCFFLLSMVVFKVFFMLSVSLSAYIIAFPLIFLAALPIVWINDRLLLKKPSLSASKIITSDTSGKSRPSLRRLTPTNTSNEPILNSFKISTLSIVSISLCMYLDFTFTLFKKVTSSSAIFFVNVVINTLSFFSTIFWTSFNTSSIWFSVDLISIFGSNNPVGLIICSTIIPSDLFNS